MGPLGHHDARPRLDACRKIPAISTYTYLACEQCNVRLWLGAAVHERHDPIYFHIGDGSEPPNWARRELNAALWKLLADHARHPLKVIATRTRSRPTGPWKWAVTRSRISASRPTWRTGQAGSPVRRADLDSAAIRTARSRQAALGHAMDGRLPTSPLVPASRWCELVQPRRMDTWPPTGAGSPRQCSRRLPSVAPRPPRVRSPCRRRSHRPVPARRPPPGRAARRRHRPARRRRHTPSRFRR